MKICLPLFVLLHSTFKIGDAFRLQPAKEVETNAACRPDLSGVYVGISSDALLSVDKRTRWMQVYWWGMVNYGPGDWVGLWDTDPNDGSFSSPLVSTSVNGIDGRFTSNIMWNDSLYPQNFTDLGNNCLGFWGAYVENDIIIRSACYRLYPNWMDENRDSISDVKLAQVALPGTHNAGAFVKYEDGLIGQTPTKWGFTQDATLLERFILGQTATKWVFTQDETLWEQLILGVRYLDMRIAYCILTESYVVTHASFIVGPLQPYLDDVKRFVENTNEIIIFDIHLFTDGFTGEVKNNFTVHLLNFFGDHLVPNIIGSNPTLNEIWATGGKVIVMFPEESSSDYIWQGVEHLWGNVNDLTHLYSYMYENIIINYSNSSNDSTVGWSAMTEFTPSYLDIAMYSWGGLRGAASITNFFVTRWLNEEWWQIVNIISMDFIASSDVIHSIVEINKIRANTSCQ